MNIKVAAFTVSEKSSNRVATAQYLNLTETHLTLKGTLLRMHWRKAELKSYFTHLTV